MEKQSNQTLKDLIATLNAFGTPLTFADAINRAIIVVKMFPSSDEALRYSKATLRDSLNQFFSAAILRNFADNNDNQEVEKALTQLHRMIMEEK